MMQLDSTVTQPITKERKLVRTYVNRDKKARRGTEVSGQVGSCPVSEKYAYTEHGTIGEQNRETGIDPNLEDRLSYCTWGRGRCRDPLVLHVHS